MTPILKVLPSSAVPPSEPPDEQPASAAVLPSAAAPARKFLRLSVLLMLNMVSPFFAGRGAAVLRYRANLMAQTLTVCYGSPFVASVFPMFPQRFGGAVLCGSCCLASTRPRFTLECTQPLSGLSIHKMHEGVIYERTPAHRERRSDRSGNRRRRRGPSDQEPPR
jgi:hypothetical protein